MRRQGLLENCVPLVNESELQLANAKAESPTPSWTQNLSAWQSGCAADHQKVDSVHCATSLPNWRG
jgi:hypothetical protein